MPDPLLHFESDVAWSNKHQNITTRIARLYDVWNRWSDRSRPAQSPWRAGLAALQQIVVDAQGLGRRVRALGGAWSLSDAAVTPDFLVNTKPLNYRQIGVRPDSCHPAFDGVPERLVFAQCGTSVLELNQTLEAAGLSLATSGASNGQTIAGAISTGTHGSANQVGSMQDFILGLHLVTEDGASVWIEPASRPVVSQRFCTTLGAELRRDDELFRAALVAFGSFGLIHAVLFEAVPIYLLERHVRRYDFDEVRDAIGTLDVESLFLPDGAELPFHFEVVVNPYAVGPGEQGAFVRCLYRRPFQPAAAPAPGPVVTTGAGDDLLGAIGAITDAVPGIIPLAMEELMERELQPVTGARGTHGQTFGSTNIRGPVLSTELGVALADAERAVDVIVEVARTFPFAGLVALRFVRSSSAHLAFTRFDPISCTIELPCSGSPRSSEAFRRIWEALAEDDISYTLHWGQCLPPAPDWVAPAYGARLDAWRTARAQLLSVAGRRTFSNALTDRYQLGG